MNKGFFVSGLTDVGQQRQENEDSIRVVTRGDGARLLIVCDGMGGHEAGGPASRAAADTLVSVLETSSPADRPAAIYEALQRANDAVHAEARRRGGGMMG